jgi:hypothetical protein
LPFGAELTVRFSARINVKGRTGTLFNTALASAAVTDGGTPSITDTSTNGTEPDANNNGTAADDSAPTPVDTQMAALQLSKLVSLPRRLDHGVFEFDYTVRVTNIGSTPAPSSAPGASKPLADDWPVYPALTSAVAPLRAAMTTLPGTMVYWPDPGTACAV